MFDMPPNGKLISVHIIHHWSVMFVYRK